MTIYGSKFDPEMLTTVMKTIHSIFFCCPDCGMQFKETDTYITTTVHECRANPHVMTFVESPSQERARALKEREDREKR